MRIFTQSCVVRNNSHCYHQLIRGVWKVTVFYHLWLDSSAKLYDRTLLPSCSLWTRNFSYPQSRTIRWISARCPLVLNSEPRRARCTSRFYRTNTSHPKERGNTLSSRRMVALCKAVRSDDCAELVVWRRIARDVMGFAELPEESQSDPISKWRECRLTYSSIHNEKKNPCQNYCLSSHSHVTVFILHLSLHMAKEKSEKKRKDVPQDIPQDVDMADATEKVGVKLFKWVKFKIFPFLLAIEEKQRKVERRNCNTIGRSFTNCPSVGAEEASQKAAENDQKRLTFIPFFAPQIEGWYVFTSI